MSAMEGGSPTKVQVDQMIQEFMETTINKRFEEHFAEKKESLERNLGKTLQEQTDKVNETKE